MAYNSYMVGAGKLIRPTGTSLAQGTTGGVEPPPPRPPLPLHSTAPTVLETCRALTLSGCRRWAEYLRRRAP